MAISWPARHRPMPASGVFYSGSQVRACRGLADCHGNRDCHLGPAAAIPRRNCAAAFASGCTGFSLAEAVTADRPDRDGSRLD